MNIEKCKVLIVTGLSGSGMSTALKALEDAGHKVVDNLPVSLLSDLLTHESAQGRSIAVGIDSRTWGFSAESILEKMAVLKQQGQVQAELVFIDCQDSVLLQRYTETRRVHPLAIDRPVADGVGAERLLMKNVRQSADHVIDTTDFKGNDLRRCIAGRFPVETPRGLRVFITSFGFKNGLPREADLVFDVRFLDNPYWYPELRPLTGKDKKIQEKIGQDVAYQEFFVNMTGLVRPLLPRYSHEGKSYLTIAIGCTGGRHRSVFTVEEMYKWLEGQGYNAVLRHRDLKPLVKVEERKIA